MYGTKSDVMTCPFCGKQFQIDGRGVKPNQCRSCRNLKYKTRQYRREYSRTHHLNQYFKEANNAATWITHLMFPLPLEEKL